ncbi:hypothetical protein V1477_008293 [Vespula maculifrons]|uniref:Uncharacterized protein n=1 Tax=Vespula maculifrons TaxID=7453 RepID=A0ABD2CCY0_VESMC
MNRLKICSLLWSVQGNQAVELLCKTKALNEIIHIILKFQPWQDTDHDINNLLITFGIRQSDFRVDIMTSACRFLISQYRMRITDEQKGACQGLASAAFGFAAPQFLLEQYYLSM